jgi:hypothetical protein
VEKQCNLRLAFWESEVTGVNNMMRLFGVLLCLAITVPVPASAQVAYKRWDEIFTPQYTKPLPPGYFDFVPVAPDAKQQSFSADGAVLCGHWRNAISYGKRIALGYSPRHAVDDIIKQRDGESVCGWVEGLIISPVRIAVRGDDADHKISIIEWVDQRGNLHYTGSLKNW